MAAHMYREPESRVLAGGGMSVIQDNGTLVGALAARNGNYLLSGEGAGLRPLVLLGTFGDIFAFLETNASIGIENQSDILPDIYMGACFYRPGDRFTGLFPLGDAVTATAAGVAGLAGGALPLPEAGAVASAVSDTAAAASDAGSSRTWGQFLFSRSNKVGPSAPARADQFYVRFDRYDSWNAGDTEKIGSNLVLFGDMYEALSYVLKTGIGVSRAAWE